MDHFITPVQVANILNILLLAEDEVVVLFASPNTPDVYHKFLSTLLWAHLLQVGRIWAHTLFNYTQMISFLYYVFLIC